MWAAFSLCVVAFSFRAYVRTVCFRRLYVDDWLMVSALVIALAANILCQLGLGYMYDIADPDFIPGPDFLSNTRTGLRQFGSAMILSYIGIWVIKLNFLLFFYRLGSKIRSYLIAWWVVLALTMACGITELGIMQTKCMFGPIMYIMTTCNLPSSMQDTYTRFKASCILDVVTDAMSEYPLLSGKSWGEPPVNQSHSHWISHLNHVGSSYQHTPENRSGKYFCPRHFHHSRHHHQR